MRCTPIFHLTAIVLITFLEAGCGGGGTSKSVTVTPPQIGDFSIALAASTVDLPQGGSAEVAVTISGQSGFASPVSVSVSRLPAAVSASPPSLQVTPGTPATISLSASASAATGTASLQVTGTYQNLAHTATASLQIIANSFTTRMKYFDLGSELPVDLNFNPLDHMLYSSRTKRFFFADSSQNQVFVFDSGTEQQIASIVVPGAFTVEQSSDGTELYVGSLHGDLFLVDPSALKVTQQIPSESIGPNGFTVVQAMQLADGRLALLGNTETDFSTWGAIGIWNRADNSLVQFTTNYAQNGWHLNGLAVCGEMLSFSYAKLSPDRTKIYSGSNGSDSTVCRIDANTLEAMGVTAPDPGYAGNTTVFLPADGKEFLTMSSGNAYLYDSNSMQITDKFSIEGYDSRNCILSVDGKTLYVVGNTVAAYDWRTHMNEGWVSAPNVNASQAFPVPQAVDETGLIAGPIGHGAGFADATVLNAGSPLGVGFVAVSPVVGLTRGGSQVSFDLPAAPSAAYFGTTPGTLTAGSTVGPVITPAHEPGPLDVTFVLPGGGLASAFQGFSYGPYVTDVITSLSTADGGGSATIRGYGFTSATNNDIPSDLLVSVGGVAAPITALQWQFAYSDGGTSQLQTLQFTIPPGTPGASKPITVSNSFGNTTAQTPLTYLPAVQSYSLPGASIQQGVYDGTRDRYYFTDRNQIRVFSISQGWLPSIMIPGRSSANLIGISLSPNGAELAVSDDLNDCVYILDVDSPTNLKTFQIPSPLPSTSIQPVGLAISDAGAVYVFTYNTNGTGGADFFKIDPPTGSFDYPNMYSSGSVDIPTRVLLSPDQETVYLVPSGGVLYAIDAHNNTVHSVGLPTYDAGLLAISPDGSTIVAPETILDSNLKVREYFAGSEKDLQGLEQVNGGVFSSDGKLVFIPLVDGIELYAISSGLPAGKLALPVTLSNGYDTLVSDGRDDLPVAITGSGDGIAVIDLSNASSQASAVPGHASSRSSKLGARNESLQQTNVGRSKLPARQ